MALRSISGVVQKDLDSMEERLIYYIRALRSHSLDNPALSAKLLDLGVPRTDIDFFLERFPADLSCDRRSIQVNRFGWMLFLFAAATTFGIAFFLFEDYFTNLSSRARGAVITVLGTIGGGLVFWLGAVVLSLIGIDIGRPKTLELPDEKSLRRDLSNENWRELKNRIVEHNK